MVCQVIIFTTRLLFFTWQNDLESCGLFYEQYAEKIKTEDEPDIMEDFKLAATEGRIGGKSLGKYAHKAVTILHFLSFQS